MLPKKFRITYSDFQNNKAKPVKYFGTNLDIYTKKNNAIANRFVFTVPKYIDKRSVYRHKLKRIMTEAVRKLNPILTTPNDILIKLKKKIGERQKEILEKEIVLLFRRMA